MTSPLLCIYCGEPADVSGEGDHVMPAAFGEFMDDVRFMSICRKCNNAIGRVEEELIRCGPESVIKSFVPLTSKRTKKRGNSNKVGAHGTPPPEYRIDTGDYTALVERDPNDPRNAYPVDQFVVRGPDGEDHCIRLFEGMRPEALRERVDKLGFEKFTQAWWHGDDKDWVRELIEQTYPEMKHEELEATPTGVHKSDGSIKLAMSNSYFRAIAKVAFHYYLTRNQRGLNGNESCFEPIRRYIRYGEGNRDDFFDKPGPKLISKMGLKVGEGQFRPTEWGHLLVATDSVGEAHAQVTLFAGPEVVFEPHRVFLGKLGPIQSPRPGLAHVYKYEKIDGTTRFAGRVYEEKLNRFH